MPTGYQQLVDGGDLAVPVGWLASVLAKVQHKEPAYKLKKLIDGLVEPAEISGITYGNMKGHPQLGKVFESLECRYI